MSPRSAYRALSMTAWAFLLLHLDLNLGTLNVLPNWACYLLLWQAIGLLAGELRDLPLLKPFCVLLGAYEGAVWVCALVGVALDGRFFLLDLILTAVALYFHFQLLTDLALLADRRREEGTAGPELGRRLRLCRDLDAVLRTVVFALILWGDAPDALVLALVVLWAVLSLVILCCLFALRASFAPKPPEEAPPE